MKRYKYYAVYKPYGMLSQFSGEAKDSVLKELFDFDKDIYPVGRLDKDSEGLLLLTNDNLLKTYLLSPESDIKKTYLVQVEGEITESAIQKLVSGSIIINHKGKKHQVKPAIVHKISGENIPARTVSIRYRKNIPTSWVSITISEGKNRQVRKMTSAVGFPTLRLIRVQIGDYKLENLIPEKVYVVEKSEILNK